MNGKLIGIAKHVKMILLLIVLGVIVFYIAGVPIASYVIAQGNMVFAQGAPKDGGNTPELSKLVMKRDTSDLSEIWVPDQGTQYGTIACDRIALSAPIYYGDSEELLLNGVGQYPNGNLPGRGKPFLLSGHDATYFAPLENLLIGDNFTVTTDYGIYEYSVTSKLVADATDLSAYDLTQEKEQMILYTCYPFGQLVGNRSKRFFVYCDPVVAPVIE